VCIVRMEKFPVEDMDQLAKDSKDVYYQKNVMKSRCKFRLTGIVYVLIEKEFSFEFISQANFILMI